MADSAAPTGLTCTKRGCGQPLTLKTKQRNRDGRPTYVCTAGHRRKTCTTCGKQGEAKNFSRHVDQSGKLCPGAQGCPSGREPYMRVNKRARPGVTAASEASATKRSRRRTIAPRPTRRVRPTAKASALVTMPLDAAATSPVPSTSGYDDSGSSVSGASGSSGSVVEAGSRSPLDSDSSVQGDSSPLSGVDGTCQQHPLSMSIEDMFSDYFTAGADPTAAASWDADDAVVANWHGSQAASGLSSPTTPNAATAGMLQLVPEDDLLDDSELLLGGLPIAGEAAAGAAPKPDGAAEVGVTLPVPAPVGYASSSSVSSASPQPGEEDFVLDELDLDMLDMDLGVFDEDNDKSVIGGAVSNVMRWLHSGAPAYFGMFFMFYAVAYVLQAGMWGHIHSGGKAAAAAAAVGSSGATAGHVHRGTALFAALTQFSGVLVWAVLGVVGVLLVGALVVGIQRRLRVGAAASAAKLGKLERIGCGSASTALYV